MNTQKKERRRLRKLHEFLIQHDIRYLGPISYQGFQVLGWICIVLSVVATLLMIAGNVNPTFGKQITSFWGELNTLTSLALPFLLIANFSRILSNNEGYKVLLLRNGGIALGLILIPGFFFVHHVIGTIGFVVKDKNEIITVLTNAISSHSRTGYIAFNLFLDLFLCTLTMYFLNTRPKRFFTGKKILILRFCVVLPVAYELFFMVLKYEAAHGRFVLPLWTYPFMPVKPIMTFALFLFLAIHVKAREYRFCRKGRTHEEYMEFQKTNQNSFHFGVLLAISMLITGLVDAGLAFLINNYQFVSLGIAENVDQKLQVYMTTYALGFGKASSSMVIAAPLMLLYSFNRVPKRKIISLLVPAAAIALALILVIEGLHYGIGVYLKGITDESGLIPGGLDSLNDILGGM